MANPLPRVHRLRLSDVPMKWKDVEEMFKDSRWGMTDPKPLDITGWMDLATLELRPPEWACEWISAGWPEPPPWMYWKLGVKTLAQLHELAEQARLRWGIDSYNGTYAGDEI